MKGKRTVTPAMARAAMAQADPETKEFLAEGERRAKRAGVDFGQVLAFMANNLPRRRR